ncbi:hypothetical protein ACFQY4_34870 [Catellatospora bangladeshensis]|uniref:hypothetical protein n=1 Tax=Catellatospora bangladeshensis TaxID=310355 RepID=UPI00361E2489
MLDDDAARLAVGAARVIIAPMAAQAWAAIKREVVSIFAWDGEERALWVEQQLDATRQDAVNGRLDQSRAVGKWEGLIEDLLRRHPEVGGQLAEIASVHHQESPHSSTYNQGDVTGRQNQLHVGPGGAFSNSGDIHLGDKVDNRKNFNFRLGAGIAILVLLLGGGVGAVVWGPWSSPGADGDDLHTFSDSISHWTPISDAGIPADHSIRSIVCVSADLCWMPGITQNKGGFLGRFADGKFTTVSEVAEAPPCQWHVECPRTAGAVRPQHATPHGTTTARHGNLPREPTTASNCHGSSSSGATLLPPA